jgi:hypothetical protein
LYLDAHLKECVAGILRSCNQDSFSACYGLCAEQAGAKPVKALAMVQMDAPVTYAVLEALRSIEAMLEVRLGKLPEAGF